jgi:AAA domain
VKARALPRLLVLWGLPGTGKSTYARWLAGEKGFTHIDTDNMGAGSNPVEWSWFAVVNQGADPARFVRLAAGWEQPVVLESGVYPTADLPERMRAEGAKAWWFDGDQLVARQAWREKNSRRTAPYRDSLWAEVVGNLELNRPLTEEFFGPRLIRTVEAGPTHVPPPSSSG